MLSASSRCCAAYTAVDACETETDLAYRINSLANRYVAEAARRVGAHVLTISTDYVVTMGIPIVEGRTFEPSDAAGPPAVLINETMARTFYRDQSPIGRRVQPSGAPGIPFFTIVGVLKDVKQGGVDKKTGTELYFNLGQVQVDLGDPKSGIQNLITACLYDPEYYDAISKEQIEVKDAVRAYLETHARRP